MLEKNIPEFESLSGMRVKWETLPEIRARQKLTVEMTGGSTDIDAFFTALHVEKKRFWKAGCERCGDSTVVGFSCKGRAFCPSCGGRRMSELAAHLIDLVFPRVPIRQWVFTVPVPVRYQLAFDVPLTRAVLRVSLRTGSAGSDGVPQVALQSSSGAH